MEMWWHKNPFRNRYKLFFLVPMHVQYIQEDRWGWEHVLLNTTIIKPHTPPHLSPFSKLIFNLLWVCDPYQRVRGIEERSLVVGKSLATCGESFKMLSHFKMFISCSKRKRVLRRQPFWEELEGEGLDVFYHRNIFLWWAVKRSVRARCRHPAGKISCQKTWRNLGTFACNVQGNEVGI